MDLNKIIKNTEYGILDFTLQILNFLKLNLAGFLKFLFNKNIIQTGIGIIVASQIGKITNMFVDTILNPIIERVTRGSIKSHEDLVITVFDVKIKIGIIISHLINFMLITYIIYNIWRISQYSNFDFITNIITETKDNINRAKVNNANILINIPPQLFQNNIVL